MPVLCMGEEKPGGEKGLPGVRQEHKEERLKEEGQEIS